MLTPLFPQGSAGRPALPVAGPAPPLPAAAGPEPSADLPACRPLGGLLAQERAVGSQGRPVPQPRHREDRPASHRTNPLPSVSMGVGIGPRFPLAPRVHNAEAACT